MLLLLLHLSCLIHRSSVMSTLWIMLLPLYHSCLIHRGSIMSIPSMLLLPLFSAPTTSSRYFITHPSFFVVVPPREYFTTLMNILLPPCEKWYSEEYSRCIRVWHYLYTHKYMYMYVHIHTHINIYISTYIYIYIYIYIVSSVQPIAFTDSFLQSPPNAIQHLVLYVSFATFCWEETNSIETGGWDWSKRNRL